MLRETLTRDLHPTARQHLSALEASKLGHRHLIINPFNSTNTLTDTQWKYALHFRYLIPLPGLRTHGLCPQCNLVRLSKLNNNLHALACNTQQRNAATVRHDNLLLILDATASSIGIRFDKEPQAFQHLFWRN